MRGEAFTPPAVAAAPTILVVDDDAAFRDVVRSALEGRGYRVVQASSARRATALLGRTPPDLVVVDGLLPDETGVRWIEMLRSQGHALDVVFVSAFWRDLGSFRHLTSDLGVRLVAQKPISIDRFVEQIGRLLPAPKAPPESAAMDATAVDGALARLTHRFARALPLRVHELSAQCERLADPAAAPEARPRAITLAHRLAGTAGTYGFVEVGCAAGALESALRAPTVASSSEDVLGALAALTTAARSVTPKPRELPRSPLFPRALLVGAPALAEATIAACHERLIALEATSYAAAIPRLLRDPPAVAALQVGRDTHARALALGTVLRGRHPGGLGQLAYLVPPGDETLQREAARQPGVVIVPDTLGPLELARLLEDLALRAAAPPGRVLLVADELATSTPTRALLLQAGLEVITREPARALAELVEQAPDLILFDLHRPAAIDLAELVQRVRSQPTWEGAPIVVLGRGGDADADARIYAAGADDVIEGPLTPGRAITRVRQRIDHRRITQTQAGLDALTRLPARGRFVDGLAAMLAEGRRHLRPTVVALLDLDSLGEWNARHGRTGGDRLLVTLAQLLESRLRAEDLRARLVHGTFAVAFSGGRIGAIQAAVQGVLADFSSGATSVRGDPPPTFSAGLATAPDDADDTDALVCRAFERLTEAKTGGRNRVVSGGMS